MKRVQFTSPTLPYLFLLPQMAVVFVFFYWPSVQAIQSSFYLEDPFGFGATFVGLDNYAEALKSAHYRQIASFTVIFTILVTFFSLSIGFGIMITYASYRKRRSNLTSPGLVVAFANSSFEILAGIGVFATLGFLAFRQGVDVSELDGIAGVGLSFVTFPAIVSEMPGGPIFGALFFGSLAMAGFTSLVSVLQVVIAAVQEKLSISRRAAAVGIGGVSAVLSVLFFSTTTGLLALDVTDMWANNVGIVASAVLMTILVIWVLRRGPELRYHLNAVSTFSVGRIWIGLVGVLAPLVLGYMLVARIITLLTEGYDTYPFWYLGIFGWGTVAVLVLGAVIGTLVPWRHSPDDYRAWPPYPAASVDNRKEARR